MPHPSVFHNYVSVFFLAFILFANIPSRENCNSKLASASEIDTSLIIQALCSFSKEKKKSKKCNFISNTNCSIELHLRLALRFSVYTVARGSSMHLVITLEVSLEGNCFVYDKKHNFCFKLCSKEVEDFLRCMYGKKRVKIELLY